MLKCYVMFDWLQVLIDLRLDFIPIENREFKGWHEAEE